MKKDCSALIPAAGFSSRMGKIKLALEMSDGKTFLENICRQFVKFGCNPIVVVVNKSGSLFLEQTDMNLPDSVKIVLNEHPERGRFYSIRKGLSVLERKQYVFIHNVDNPFVETEVLDELYKNRSENKWVKPVYKGKSGHPVLLPPKICSAICSEARDDLRLDSFLQAYTHKKVEVNSKKILININTFDDYEKLF